MLKPAFSFVFPGKQNQWKRLVPPECKSGLGRQSAKTGFLGLPIFKLFHKIKSFHILELIAIFTLKMNNT